MTSTQTPDLLRQGLEFHRLGNLERAGSAYSEALSANPLRADAMHLFGVVLHEMGDHESALRAIARATALQPNVAHYHVNLGEVYRAGGDHHRWAGCLAIAWKLRPEGFRSLDDFDVLIHDPDRREATSWPSIELTPRVSGPAADLTSRAYVLRSSGDRIGAADLFFEAVRLDPAIGEGHSNLGMGLLELGRLAEARYHCEEAVRLSPDLPEAWNHLGNVLRAQSRFIEARSCYLDALRLDPRRAMILDNLAILLLDEMRSDESLAWFRMALEVEPDSFSIRSNLAGALKNLGRLDEASALCEEALAIEPESEKAHVCLGSIRHEQGRLDEATAAFRRAARANPDFIPAHQSLGIILTEMGELEAADRAYREVLQRPGDPSRALFGLTCIHQGKLPDADLAAILDLLADPDLARNRRADLHFSAAQVFDGRGEHPRAADHLRQGNAIKLDLNVTAGRGYRPDVHDRLVEDLIDACSPEFFARAHDYGQADARPIFVFGLPRSGTTLTEQILASHSKVRGAGELVLGQSSFDSMPAVTGSTATPVECLDRLDRESSIRIARSHLAGLAAIDPDVPHIVDKMPENYLYLGLLAVLFPRARFIHCRRDLRDTAVSCWSTNFWNYDWSHDMGHIASRFAAYGRLMAHWNRVLPLPMLHVDYEETVADLETTARRLVDWCGLEWEPACLEFHRSRRAVRTASVTQVRQPIYRKSVARWKNYEADLQPFLEQIRHV